MELLTISVFLAIFGIILLWFEVNALKRDRHMSVSRAVVAMELRRQMDAPDIQAAIAQVRHLGEASYLHNSYASNGHAQNGHLSNGHTPSLNGHAAASEAQDLVVVDQFFSHVGELVRRGIADDEVFALMGPTISEMWHSMRPLRTHSVTQDGESQHIDDFDYLYTAWLNWDHQHHTYVTPSRFTPANGVLAHN